MTLPTPPGGLTIRNMTRAEVADIAVAWAASEGWNPGLNDAGIFFDSDPQGFFLAELEGQPVGCVSSVVYDDAYAFGGFFMVPPQFRGKGIGVALAAKALQRSKGRILGQDGVVAQQENYKSMGFEMAFKSVRYQGTGGGEAPEGLVDINTLPFEQVLAYDRRQFPAPRPGFLRGWISQPGGTALGLVKDGELLGYGVLRPCQEGFKIGPLFADHPDTAQALYAGLAARAPGAPVFLDAPHNNPEAIKLARAHHLEPVFETARMYLGGIPPWPTERIYGITTFELG